MKVVVFLAILAFASAKPYAFLEQKTNDVTPFWHQFLPQQYRQQYSPQEHWQQYWEQYWPQEEGVQVAQHVAYQFFQAYQNRFTPAQFSLYLMKQGYPEPIVHYLVQEYEAFQTKLYGQSPYHTFQFYYEQRIPEEHFQWLSQQIHHAYQQYPQYYLKNIHQDFEQVYPYHSIAQFVNQQAYYYAQHGVTHKVAQYAYQQLQQVEEYVQNAFQYLKSSNVPRETYQYLLQELQQGQHYLQLAQKVYMSYENVKVNYIPYYAAMYLSEQIHHADQHFQNVYHFIYQQQAQGYWPQDAHFLVQQMQFVHQSLKDAYKVYYYYPFDTTHYTPSYEHQHSEQYPWIWKMNWPKSFTGDDINKNVEYKDEFEHDEKFQVVPYSSSYQHAYQYWPMNQHYESYRTQYPSTYQYHGFNFNQWNKPYQYETPSYPYNYWNSQVAIAA